MIETLSIFLNKKEDPVIIKLYYDTPNKKRKNSYGYIFIQSCKYKVTI